MIHIYEKVIKDEKYQYGIKEIIDENPFENPCIITLIAIPDKLKYINGALRTVANLVNPQIDIEYNPNKRILGLGYGNYRNPTLNEIDEFIDKYFYPLFTEDNKKIDILKVMRNFRNITFLTYCNGARNYKLIENALKKKMTDIGYEVNEIKLILSQICLVSLTGNIIKSVGTDTTCISFGDIYDEKYEADPKTIIDILNRNSNREYLYVNYESLIGFVTARCEDGDLYRYMFNDPVITPRIKAVLNASLENAIDNRDNDIFNPITYSKIEEVLEDKKVLKKTLKENVL